MLYKPTFCSHCGEKVERTRWGLLTSRRFCQLCETDFKHYEWLPRVVVAFGMFLVLLGLGGFWQTAEKPLPISNKQPANKKMQIVSSQTNVLPPETSGNFQTNQPAASNSPAATAKLPTAESKVPKQIEKPPSAPEAVVYFCGAQTKKGTPCSRRVKGGGRCWQHEGQEAMLPPEKLKIQ